LIRSSSNI